MSNVRQALRLSKRAVSLALMLGVVGVSFTLMHCTDGVTPDCANPASNCGKISTGEGGLADVAADVATVTDANTDAADATDAATEASGDAGTDADASDAGGG